MTNTSMRVALSGALAAFLVAAAPAVFTAQQADPGTKAAAPRAAASPAAPSAPAPAAPAESQLATVEQYCTGCHNDRSKMAGVSFEGLTPEAIAQHPDV